MSDKNSTKTRWDRQSSTQKVIEFEQTPQYRTSQRAFAKEQNIPRTTLQHWLNCKKHLCEEQAKVAAFLETPEGLQFLHRIVVAAQFVFTQVGGDSIHNVSLFLRKSKLDRFVASSYGSQQAAIGVMEEVLGSFGEEERARLAQNMEALAIFLCEDETFHPAICLVAIEPLSDFILLEKYAPDRSVDTWNEATNEAFADLSVDVVGCASDNAPSLVSHIEKGLGAHHSPDLFHVQHELVKGTSLALAAQTRRAEEELGKAKEHTAKEALKKEQYEANIAHRGPGRPPDFDKKLARAKKQQKRAKQTLAETQKRQQQTKDAIRGLAASYHPFGLESSQKRNPEKVQKELQQHFAVVEKVVGEAGLGERSGKRLKKAKRVLPQMVATIAFFHSLMRTWLQGLGLNQAQLFLLEHRLIPGYYIQLVAGRERDRGQAKKFAARAKTLLAPFHNREGPFAELDEAEYKRIKDLATGCAGLFIRSSSCVEGRNGQLALRHRCFHRLSERKLKALTVVHNYFIERHDGTTAAERFFGNKPRDLFEFLLDAMPLPKRPAQRRTRTAA